MFKVRPLSIRDIPLITRWRNNPRVDQFISDESGRHITLAGVKIWFRNYRRDRHKKFFLVSVDNTPIGWMGISHISRQNRNAELFLAIGEDSYRGRGFGKKSLAWLVDFAFKKLKLHKVKVGVFDHNRPSLGLCKSLGFKKEGYLKDEVRVGGKWHGQLELALFARDWK